MTPAQFALAQSETSEKLLMRAQWIRMLGWSLIILPIVSVAMSQTHHQDSLFMVIGEMVMLEIFLGGLGWFMLWLASQLRERARQIGGAP